jgi:large subunit ribosomal protein L24
MANHKQKMNIKQGDQVIVIAGKDRSYRGRQRRGKVIGALPGEQRVIVEGMNILKRAVRQNQRVRQGGIISSPGPIHISNVMLVCPACDAPTRVGHRVNNEGRKVRVCKQCERDID